MAFLGINESKVVEAIAEKLKLQPTDTVVSLLVDVLERLATNNQAHVVLTIGGTVVDCVLKIEDRP